MRPRHLPCETVRPPRTTRRRARERRSRSHVAKRFIQCMGVWKNMPILRVTQKRPKQHAPVQATRCQTQRRPERLAHKAAELSNVVNRPEAWTGRQTDRPDCSVARDEENCDDRPSPFAFHCLLGDAPRMVNKKPNKRWNCLDRITNDKRREFGYEMKTRATNSSRDVLHTLPHILIYTSKHLSWTCS